MRAAERRRLRDIACEILEAPNPSPALSAQARGVLTLLGEVADLEARLDECRLKLAAHREAEEYGS